jgi:hypothetical protein
MSTRNKIILTSMDSIFKHITIDPDLPDPATYDGYHYQRAIPDTFTTWSNEPAHLSDTSTYKKETFVKRYLVEPTWGERFFYWHRCD